MPVRKSGIRKRPDALLKKLLASDESNESVAKHIRDHQDDTADTDLCERCFHTRNAHEGVCNLCDCKQFRRVI